MWIDRFLYAIVAIVMPVALYKSLVYRLLPFVDQRSSSRIIIPSLDFRRLFFVHFIALNFTLLCERISAVLSESRGKREQGERRGDFQNRAQN